jgi:hypothetical protein
VPDDAETTLHAERVARFRRLYDAFNRREIDDVLAYLAPDVDWPNVAERSRVVGHDAVRAYWAAQFERINPRVEPTDFVPRGDDLVIAVHQTVRDLDGKILSESDIAHAYSFTGELVAQMNVHPSVEDALK